MERAISHHKTCGRDRGVSLIELLVVLAITMLIGRYNNYKLTEYMRFRQLQKSLRDLEDK